MCPVLHDIHVPSLLCNTGQAMVPYCLRVRVPIPTPAAMPHPCYATLRSVPLSFYIVFHLPSCVD